MTTSTPGEVELFRDSSLSNHCGQTSQKLGQTAPGSAGQVGCEAERKFYCPAGPASGFLTRRQCGLGWISRNAVCAVRGWSLSSVFGDGQGEGRQFWSHDAPSGETSSRSHGASGLLVVSGRRRFNVTGDQLTFGLAPPLRPPPAASGSPWHALNQRWPPERAAIARADPIAHENKKNGTAAFKGCPAPDSLGLTAAADPTS